MTGLSVSLGDSKLIDEYAGGDGRGAASPLRPDRAERVGRARDPHRVVADAPL